MEPNNETMTATEFEKANTILWGALMAGCILLSIILFRGTYFDFYHFHDVR